jgi:peptide/nickel transport system substrate-binding protein
MTDAHPADNRLTRRRMLAGTGALLAAGFAGPAGALASAASSSAAPTRGGHLTTARNLPVDGYKLDGEFTNATLMTSMVIMEPLVRFTPGRAGTDRFQAGIAASWDIDPTFTEYTFHIANGARFSTGKAVTAADIAFSVKTWQAGPNLGSTFAQIIKVTIIDPSTVKMVLAAPNSAFLDFLTWAETGIIPENFAGHSESAFWQHPIGAGPFVLTDWQPAGDVNLLRNPHYYRKGRPYLDSITNVFLSDSNQRSLQFRTKQIDIVETVTADEVRLYPKSNLTIEKPHYTDVLVFNTKVAPFNNGTLRRAIGYAIDYGAIANGIYKGYGEEPIGLVPPNLANWAPPSSPYFRKNVAMAKKLLAQAGGAPKQPITLTYTTDSAVDGLLAQVLQSNLAAIGITVKLNGVDTATLEGVFYAGKFELGLWEINAISPDCIDPLVYLAGTYWSFSGYPVAGLQALLKKYDDTSSSSVKKHVVAEIQDQAFEQAPVIALDHTDFALAVQSNIEGVLASPWGYFYYDTVWKT